MSTLYPANYSIIATPSKFVAFLLGDTTVNLKYIPSSYFLISITINFPIFPSLHVCFKHFEDFLDYNLRTRETTTLMPKRDSTILLPLALRSLLFVLTLFLNMEMDSCYKNSNKYFS